MTRRKLNARVKLRPGTPEFISSNALVSSRTAWLDNITHVPAKPALGLDPTGGHRFANKNMRHTMTLEHVPIPTDRDMLQSMIPKSGYRFSEKIMLQQ